MYSYGNFSAFFLWSPLGNYEKKERKRSELTAQNKQKERNKIEHFNNGVTLRTE